MKLVADLSASSISTYLVREGDDLAQALARPYALSVKTLGRAT